ncbi:MAG: hypothetical protein Q7S11_00150 [bacterium]|nr:hypothetical protein [bacterium]
MEKIPTNSTIEKAKEILRVEKILLSNYPEYAGKLLIETKKGHTVFSKKDSDDVSQVLVLS